VSDRPHKKLLIWNKIMSVIEDVYLMTDKFPKQEMYGLSSQMRRSSISIASNIAEGSARKGKQERIQFYSVSKGSLSELDAQLEISLRLKFADKNTYDKLQCKIDEISRMLQGLINCYKKP